MRRTSRVVSKAGEPAPSFTFMIDLVFLLLFYFVFTVRPADVMAELAVDRPDRGPGMRLSPVCIEVGEDGFHVEGIPCDNRELDGYTRRLARINPHQAILVVSAPAAAHGALIRVLDACAGAGLNNLSVLSD